MRRAAIVIPLVAALALALALPADAGRDLTPLVAKYSVRHYLAVMLAPPAAHAKMRVYDCRDSRCRFTLKGTSKCRGVVQVRPKHDGDFLAWYSRLRCD